MKKNTNKVKDNFYNKLKVSKEVREVIKLYRQYKQDVLK